MVFDLKTEDFDGTHHVPVFTIFLPVEVVVSRLLIGHFDMKRMKRLARSAVY